MNVTVGSFLLTFHHKQVDVTFTPTDFACDVGSIVELHLNEERFSEFLHLREV